MYIRGLTAIIFVVVIYLKRLILIRTLKKYKIDGIDMLYMISIYFVYYRWN